jgi:hypothetical protein
MSSVWGSILEDHQRTPSALVNSEQIKKTCTQCGQTKPISGFYHRSGRAPDKFSARCRECLKQYEKDRRSKKKKGA